MQWLAGVYKTERKKKIKNKIEPVTLLINHDDAISSYATYNKKHEFSVFQPITLGIYPQQFIFSIPLIVTFFLFWISFLRSCDL